MKMEGRAGEGVGYPLEKVTLMICKYISVKPVAGGKRLGSEKVVLLAGSDAVTARSLLGHC